MNKLTPSYYQPAKLLREAHTEGEHGIRFSSIDLTNGHEDREIQDRQKDENK